MFAFKTTRILVLLLVGLPGISCWHIEYTAQSYLKPEIPTDWQALWDHGAYPFRVTQITPLSPLNHVDSYTRTMIRFHCDTPVAKDSAGKFELWIPNPIPENPIPIILITPILAGNALECTLVAYLFTQHGWAAAIHHRWQSFIQPDYGASQMADLFLIGLHQARHILDYVSDLPFIDAERIGSMGVSLGSLRNVLLAAAEQRIKASILALSGGNLAEILLNSGEGLVTGYVNRRCQAAGISPKDVFNDYQHHFTWEPLSIAAYVDPKRVGLVLAMLDPVIPFKNGMDLYNALGKPETWLYYAGHYTSILPLLNHYSQEMIRFFEAHF